MRKTTILAGVAGLCVMSCAHQPPPTEQMAGAIAAVRAAEEAGAADVPEAQLHVKLAQEQLQQSQRLIADERNAEATDKVIRARQDAELALSLAHEQQARTKLDQFSNTSSGGELQPSQPGGT